MVAEEFRDTILRVSVFYIVYGKQDTKLRATRLITMCSVVGLCAIEYRKINVPRVYRLYVVLTSEILLSSHCIIKEAMH